MQLSVDFYTHTFREYVYAASTLALASLTALSIELLLSAENRENNWSHILPDSVIIIINNNWLKYWIFVGLTNV